MKILKPEWMLFLVFTVATDQIYKILSFYCTVRKQLLDHIGIKIWLHRINLLWNLTFLLLESFSVWFLWSSQILRADWSFLILRDLMDFLYIYLVHFDKALKQGFIWVEILIIFFEEFVFFILIHLYISVVRYFYYILQI